uniref:Uncharacterized protein n=1 Tax=Oryza nivara TaxID=4536 RepID=A0A0E0J9B8_ORYNI
MSPMSGHHYRWPISLTGVPLAISLHHRACLGEVNSFFLFPLSFPLRNQPPQPPPLVAGAVLLSPLFRPSSSLLPSTDLSGCVESGKTLDRRRRGRSTTGEPAPRSPSSLPPLGSKKQRRRRGRSVALRTPRLDAYSSQSLTTPSTSTARRTLVLELCATLATLLSLASVEPYSKFDYRIQGADVDPDGYAEAAGNLYAQGKT